MIQFNQPISINKTTDTIQVDATFFKTKSRQFFQNIGLSQYLTTSCTHALEMAALLSKIKIGDEVIMASFTFPSAANAFVLRGAKVKFIDIDPKTFNLDPTKIEAALTKQTKAIVVMHYAGIACEMNTILELAKQNNLLVIEDAAQCIGATYHGKPLGGIGDFGTYSFHYTKNIHCGEGGVLFVNNLKFRERAQVIYDKGTNRKQFLEGRVDKYTWVDVGSSFTLSELNAAYLYPQLTMLEEITQKRRELWNQYASNLAALSQKGQIELPTVPKGCFHNGHIFYIKCKNATERSNLTIFLRERNISAYFHYLPLHSSIAGRKYGEFVGVDKFTTQESERLLRLPMYYDLEPESIDYVCENIIQFYSNR